MTLLQSGITKSLTAAAYTIDQSCRFNSPDSAYLARTFSAGDRLKWTFSCWVKRGLLTGDRNLFVPTGDVVLGFYNAELYFYQNPSATDFYLASDNLYRDPAAWYNFVFVYDSAQAVTSNRIKIYVNGEQVTDFSREDYPAQDLQSNWNNNVEHQIGGNYYYDGYLAELYFIDGQALTPSDFGETDEDTNQWIPKDASGLTFGTNGFFIDFRDSADLGDDESGNGNDFTVTNLVATDQMKDSPTNNFSVWNSIASNPTYTFNLDEGNLKNINVHATYRTTLSTIGMASGKWYFESYINSMSGWVQTGIIGSDNIGDTSALVATYIGSKSAGYGYNSGDGKIYNDGVLTTYGDSYAATDIIGIAVDLDNSKLYVSKNGTWQNSGDPTSGATGTGAFSIVSQSSYYFGQGPSTCTTTANFGSDSSFAGEVTAGGNADGNGVGDFFYEPPSGYLALATSNLSDASFASIKLPSENFNMVAYTGDGTVSRAITGVGFAPDMAVAKSRSTTGQFMTVDNTRGMGTAQMKRLVWNANYASQDATTNEWTSLDSDGFTFSNTSGSGYSDLNIDTTTYVAWSWLAGGGAGSSNTDGATDTTKTSANVTAGFSISTLPAYSGPTTFGHGLSVAPDLVIMKATNNADQWTVGSTAVGWTKGLPLDTTAAEQTNSGFWNDLAPTPSVVNLGTWGEAFTRVMYCFHSVEGYSQCGSHSYTGNGNADGTFIYTGFRPTWIMCKNASLVSSWMEYDSLRSPYNVADSRFMPNTNNAEATSISFDFLSNGFKCRTSDADFNASGSTYLYIAFAEFPFKYANAR